MNEVTYGVVRHVLTAVAGALAAHGYLDGGQVEMVVGALLTMIGVIWSVLSKKATQ